MKGGLYMDRNLKKIIYTISLFAITFILVKLKQFNIISYLFGYCIAILGRWVYGK